MFDHLLFQIWCSKGGDGSLKALALDFTLVRGSVLMCAWESRQALELATDSCLTFVATTSPVAVQLVMHVDR